MEYRSNIRCINGVLYGSEANVPHIMRISLTNGYAKDEEKD